MFTKKEKLQYISGEKKHGPLWYYRNSGSVVLKTQYLPPNTKKKKKKNTPNKKEKKTFVKE
jgi:hypothetical protein